MPAVTPPGIILVTGASGFVGAWVTRAIMERGFSVRGTVRSSQKGRYLHKLFEKEFSHRFEFVVVEDMAKEGAFDKAVEGVDAVVHTASLVQYSDTAAPEDIINPTHFGMNEVLKSAHKHAPSVKRIIFTSSGATVYQQLAPGVYSYGGEDDWNNYSLDEVRAKGAAAPGPEKYRAAKVLAERALWDYVHTLANVTFDAVAVIPPLIYGPILHDVPTVSALNLSNFLVLQNFLHEVPGERLGQYAGNFVDVRDLAELHVDALVDGTLGGRRILVGNGTFTIQDLYDAAHTLSASELASLPVEIPRGVPGAGEVDRTAFPLLRNTLGCKLRPLPEVVRDSLLSWHERNLL